MQSSVQQSQQPSSLSRLAKLERASDLWPNYIRLVSALIQRSLAEFISPLLMIGLILSMSNFLLDGVIFQFSPAIPFLWAIVQCVAIDANLGVMIVRAVRNFHESEWAKGTIYLVISLALLFVAAIIFDVQEVQSVLNRGLDVIFGHLHLNIELLTMIRSSAVVALVATTQLEGISLRKQKNSKPSSVSQRRELSSFDQDGKKPETAGNSSLLVSDQMTDGLEAIKPDQLQKLSEAYEQLRSRGVPISVNSLRDAARVRASIVGPWLEIRQRMDQKSNLVSMNNGRHV